MQIQIEEKFSMITIPNASAMRERAEIRAKELEAERAFNRLVREAQEQERKMKLLARVPEILALIMEDIERATEKGATYISSKTFYETGTVWDMTHKEASELAPVLADILSKAGYDMRPEPSWYSDSWRNRSGKVFTWGYTTWGE
ncbi:MAG: hypothetical protein IIV14_07705 [Bacteroidaceae bacterium]|nr:hypothetical protein [Bacteroidaceae bacterium]